MENVVSNFDSNLAVHLRDKRAYLQSNRSVVSTGIHLVAGKPRELARFKSREDCNKESGTWAFSVDEISDLDSMTAMGYIVWVVFPTKDEWVAWKSIRIRLDMNRAGERRFVRVSI
jgi:hypothetical protein